MSRRDLIQLASVVVISIGAGLLAFSHHLNPPMGAAGVVNVARAMDHEDQEIRVVASLAAGVGVTGITLGVLGLALPWVNAFLARHNQR